MSAGFACPILILRTCLLRTGSIRGSHVLSCDCFRKHLIVSIGSECYVTLPKGQIIPTHTASEHPHAPSVPGGGHVLIVPITHYPTYSSIPPDLAAPIVEETEKLVMVLSFYIGLAEPLFKVQICPACDVRET